MKRDPSGKAFSLLELLTVVGLIMLLMAIALPVFVPVTGAAQLNRGTSLLSDTLNLARQTAMARNADVEVRFYQLPLSGANASTTKYRGFQAFLVQDGANPQPLDKLKRLPDTVVILDDVKFSTLLDYTNPARAGLERNQDEVPELTAKADYISFRFRSAGSTTLSPVTPPNDLWFLTLALEKQAARTAPNLPENYSTVQVEPVTGRVKVLRP